MMQRQFNQLACLVAGRDPDPILFQFLSEEVRQHYDSAWAQMTEYYAQFDREREAFLERSARRHAEADAKAKAEAKAKEDKGKEETKEEKDQFEASTSQAKEQDEAQAVATSEQAA